MSVPTAKPPITLSSLLGGCSELQISGFKNLPGTYEYYITGFWAGRGMDAKLTKNITSKAPFE